jgi:hypothetical protein
LRRIILRAGALVRQSFCPYSAAQAARSGGLAQALTGQQLRGIVGSLFVRTLAQSLFADSAFNFECELPRAGSALENPYVYDASARELKSLAERGLIEVVKEQTIVLGNETLIGRFSFKRVQ